jgi:hypothetical protein
VLELLLEESNDNHLTGLLAAWKRRG